MRSRLVMSQAASAVSEPENIQTQVGSEHQQFRVPDVGRALAEDTGPESNKLWR